MARHLYIAGTDRWGDYVGDSLIIDQVLTQVVDACQFRMRGDRPMEGQEVKIEDDTLGRLFGGIIDRVQLLEKDPAAIWQVECQDYTYQLDKKLVVETYENKAADWIVMDIITKYCPGFTSNNVQPGAPIVEKVTFEYKRPSECKRELSEYCGWDFFVDYSRDVHFFNPLSASAAAPMTLEPGGSFRNFKHIVDTQGLRNRVFVRGGTMLSAFQTLEWKADGAARTWTLPWKPHEISFYIGGAPKTVGIENMDEESTKDYLLNYQEKYIRCSAQSAIPANGTTISLTAKQDIDVITIAEDLASQAAIAAVQGGDGVYEHVISDDSLATIEAAEAAGQADIREHSNPRVKGSFETEVNGWQPGQLATINLPDRGVTGTFLIQKVVISPATDTLWTYRVEYGGRLLGIADFLKALVSAQQRRKFNDTSIMHKYVYGQDQVLASDELFITPRVLPYICGDIDAVCGLVVCSSG